jgi:hypothetical protein
LRQTLAQLRQRLFMQQVREGVLERTLADVSDLQPGPIEERLQEMVLSNFRDRELLGRFLERHPALQLEMPRLTEDVHRDMIAHGMMLDEQ